jgi:hypothetical protein
MDFKELWDKAGAPDIPPPDRSELEAMLGKESQGLLAKLKRQLKHKLIWGVGITIPFSILMIMMWGNWAAVTLLGLMTVMCAFLMVFIYRYYRRLPDHLDMSQGMLPLMKSYNQIVRQALRFEERAGAFFVIFSPGMGAVFSMISDGKRTLQDVLTDPVMLIIIGIATVVAGPPAVWLTIWMNKYAFGKSLDQLKKNIEALEAA